MIAWVAMLACASQALAHAQILGSSPASGATVAVQPSEVLVKFNENVGRTPGAVRVYDTQGNEVDDLDVNHPYGDERWIGVGLKRHLPDGTYTATYRVVSTDTHIVYGGLVFSIGHRGPAPRFSVAGLIGRDEAGSVTNIAFGVVRTLDYLSLALFIGGLAFAWLAWGPALDAVGRGGAHWAAATSACAKRVGVLLAVAIVTGALVSVLGVLLQGASTAGVSLWSSLKASVVENTLESRFGEVWAGRAIDWLLIGMAMLIARASGAAVIPRLEPVSTSPGQPRVRGPGAVLSTVLETGCAYLAITPALAGHASIQSPTGVFLPANAIHVLAASVWVGGIASLVVALPAASRQLEGSDRGRLLFATLSRFSPVALVSVVAIAATGLIQAYIDVRSFDGLFHTTYGVLIVAKTALLLVLIGLGWVNRERVIPVLRRIVSAGAAGKAGMLACRSMRGELALMLCVFGVTAALITYAPPIDAVSGPFSTHTTIGAAELEMTVEPARIGPNTIHLDLSDAKTGVQFTATKELTARARLPSKHIGPLPLKTSIAGPGHYILSSAVLSPGGTWEIEIVDRISEFESNTRLVKVPIR